MKLSEIKREKELNPRLEIDPSHVQALARSINSKLGMIDKIWLQKGTGELIAGEYRLRALQQLKRSQIPNSDIQWKDVTDAEARRIALIQQFLNKPLNEIELGRAAVRILSAVKRGNRTKQIDELGRELGHRDGREIRESMTTYRGLHPQIIPVVEKALSKGTVSVDDVRLLRTLRKDQQLGAQRLETMTERSQGSNFIRGFVASVKPVGKVKASLDDQRAADARMRKFQHPHIKDPPANELVQAKMLRFLREVPFDAEGICPKCGQSILLKNAQVTFSTPLWKKDLLPLLRTTIEEIFPSIEA